MKHLIDCPCKLIFEDRIRHFYLEICSVCRVSPRQKRNFLERAPPCFYNFLADCSRGILYNHIKFPPPVYKKLRRYRNDFLTLANKRTSNKHRRALIVQKKGGFLPLILPALASALFGILGNVISKKLL